MHTTFAAILLLLAPRLHASAPIPLSASGIAHTYTGHGGLSAGASSRLLLDYPEPQRSDILDFLFRPQWGLSLHLIKVELGGDSQSTDGTEPSHEHTRGDLSCTRGYELFLLKEAKKRNPAILTYGLSWGAPNWINNGTSYFGPEMPLYQADWVRCMAQEGVAIDYIGVCAWPASAVPASWRASRAHATLLTSPPPHTHATRAPRRE